MVLTLCVTSSPLTPSPRVTAAARLPSAYVNQFVELAVGDDRLRLDVIEVVVMVQQLPQLGGALSGGGHGSSVPVRRASEEEFSPRWRVGLVSRLARRFPALRSRAARRSR